MRACPVSRGPRAGVSSTGSASQATTRTRRSRRHSRPPCAADASPPAQRSVLLRRPRRARSSRLGWRLLPEQPLLLAVPFALLDRRALVVLLLALREPDGELHAALRVMKVERRQRVACTLDLADQPVDFLAMHEKAPRAGRIRGNVRRRRRQRRDMRADQHEPSVLDDHIRLLEIRATAADRLHFPAFERNPGLEALLDKIVVKGLTVLDDAHCNAH